MAPEALANPRDEVLLDYFAGQVLPMILQGVMDDSKELRESLVQEDRETHDLVKATKSSYRIAHAMLLARKEQAPGLLQSIAKFDPNED